MLHKGHHVLLAAIMTQPWTHNTQPRHDTAPQHAACSIGCATHHEAEHILPVACVAHAIRIRAPLLQAKKWVVRNIKPQPHLAGMQARYSCQASQMLQQAATSTVHMCMLLLSDEPLPG